MTDTTDTNEPVEAADTATDATEHDTNTEDTTPATNTDDSDDAQDNANREAAKYRRKLRATEAERDQLAQNLDLLQRAEVERIAATVLTDPTDVWVAGTELGQLRDTNGNIDPNKLKAVLNDITEARPHWKLPARRPATLDGQRSGASGNELPTTTSWAQALTAE